jgi:hypothetical protein
MPLKKFYENLIVTYFPLKHYSGSYHSDPSGYDPKLSRVSDRTCDTSRTGILSKAFSYKLPAGTLPSV